MSQHWTAIIGRLALLGTTLIWGSSFIILKATLDSVPTLWILAIRFTGACLLMGAFSVRELKKLDRSAVKYGLAMGAALYAAYTLQTYGLLYTTPGKNAFLTASYCVLVPFLWWLFYKKRPDRFNVAAALVCITGMALVSLDGSLGLGLGDALTMCCGLFYALHIIVSSRALEKYSVTALTTVQLGTAAVLCWLTAPLAAPFPESVPASAWLSIAYLCVMCTGVCYFLQALGQKYTSPQTASILLTLESVFGTLFSVVFYHEHLSLRTLSGFVLIFIAILISETKLSFLRPKSAVKN